MKIVAALALVLAAAGPAQHFAYVTGAGGQRIAYTVQGAGPAMLVIPGGPGIDGTYLRDAVRGLRARSYVMDLRGTGASHVRQTTQNITVDNILRDFEALRKARHLRSWIVLGHSFGGYLAQAYAAHYPQSVRAMILVSSTAPDLSLEGQVQKTVGAMLSDADRSRLQSLGALSRSNPDAAMQQQTDLILPYFFADRSKWAKVQPLVDPPHNSYAMARAIYPDLQAHPYAGNLHMFKPRILVLYGDKDGGVDIFSKNILDNAPSARLGIVSNAGHFIWIEQPAVFRRTINSFLSQIH